jgi:serine protease Do
MTGLRISMFVFLLACALSQPSVARVIAGSHVSMPLSSQAQKVVEAVQPSVLQVRTIPLGSDAPFSYGSGFAVGTENLILTNYHVVSSVVIDPDRYRLEYLRQDGSKGPLVVVAIDVVHDLAIVRGSTGPMRSLEFELQIPEKGERGFSIGFPQNQGLAVTEGIVNGLSEDSVREAIHFSGAVNSGMSGGPAVDASGRVFGVNVANLRGSQLISFVVPAKAAIELIGQAQRKRPLKAGDLLDEITRQLQSNSRETLALIPEGKLPVEPFGQFRVPAKPGEFARCSSRNEKEADKLFQVAQTFCYFKDETFVSSGLNLGYWLFGHRRIKAPEFGALRLANVEEAMLEPRDDTSAASRMHKTRWACQERIVALDSGRAKAVLCLRRYTRFAGLYDIEFRMATITHPGDALLSTLDLTGFGYPESMAFIRRFMEAITWQP